mgnify:CR=1 FL=1
MVERDQRATVVATSGFAEELEDAKSGDRRELAEVAGAGEADRASVGSAQAQQQPHWTETMDDDLTPGTDGLRS